MYDIAELKGLRCFDSQGFGPQFRLSLELVNLSDKRSCLNLLIGFHYNDRLYAVSPSHIPVPFLVPGVEYRYRVTVECSSDAGQTDIIEVRKWRRGDINIKRECVTIASEIVLGRKEVVDS